MIEVLIEFSGYLDNIRRNLKGEYWVGVYLKRGGVLKWFFLFFWIGNIIVNFLFNGIKLVLIFVRLRVIGLVVKLDEDGNIV